jgi:hypothetical protein
MVRGLILGSAVAATALATASFPAFAYGCRNGRSTDPNCYREYGYACGPCYNATGAVKVGAAMTLARRLGPSSSRS